MNKLPTYTSIDEMRKAFDVVDIIKDRDSLESLINKYRISHEFIYRGVNNASFKIFASSQRDYILKGLANRFSSYYDYLNCIFANSKTVRNNLMEKFYDGTRQNLRYFPLGQRTYNELSIPYNNFWAFSFIQHYKIPTPLIDFSDDFMAALFFAWDGSSRIRCKYCSNLPSDFMQINFFNKEDLQTQNNFESIMQYSIDEAKKSNPQDVYSALQSFISFFDFFTIPTTPKIYYISRSGSVRTLDRVPINFEIDVDFNILNLNIIAQNGLFIINYDEKQCLEEQWNHINLPRIKKLLIHRSLVNEVKTVLKQNSNDKIKASYYPQEEEIVKEVYDNVLK